MIRTGAAVALALALAAPALACNTFTPGLCPGPSSCMCTSGATCAADNATAPEPAWKEGKLGGCPGSCMNVEHNRCPGSSSCLLASGKCGGGGGGGCLGPAGSPCACTGKPASGNYFLTTFDGSSCSCGPCHEYGPYFTADRQRFGCGAHLIVCRGGNCVKSRVTDYGPGCWVENDAGGPILDAGPALCQNLTGHSSCGWSDHFTVHVSVALSPEEDGRPLGLFKVTPAEFADIVATGLKIEKERRMEMVKGW